MPFILKGPNHERNGWFYIPSMPTERVLITTPMPTADEVADQLGIPMRRRKVIYGLAKSAIENYYAANPPGKTKNHKKTSSLKKKAA